MAAMAMITIFIGYNNYIYEYKQKRQKPILVSGLLPLTMFENFTVSCSLWQLRLKM